MTAMSTCQIVCEGQPEEDEAGTSEEKSLTQSKCHTTPASESQSALYNDLPPERKSQAQDYIRTLTIIENEDSVIGWMEASVSKHKENLETLNQESILVEKRAAKEKRRAHREYVRMIQEAANRREQRIKDIDREEEALKNNLKIPILECAAMVTKAEQQTSRFLMDFENAKKRKLGLEEKGGFQLGWDVRAIEEKRKRQKRE
jgi:hypothetical protein